jgi:hypothetical protein
MSKTQLLLPVATMLELSTGHVEQHDMELLKHVTEFAAYSYPEGCFLPIGQDISTEELEQIGFSAALVHIYYLCVAHKIAMLRLDRDIPVQSTLPIFKWKHDR